MVETGEGRVFAICSPESPSGFPHFALGPATVENTSKRKTLQLLSVKRQVRAQKGPPHAPSLEPGCNLRLLSVLRRTLFTQMWRTSSQADNKRSPFGNCPPAIR